MDEMAKLKEQIEKLQVRLREETNRRMDLERRCSILEKLAHRDPTTGLRTENYLHARVREEIDRSIRFPSTTSLVTLYFPEQNDLVLPRVGQRLSDESRTTDQVFKFNESSLAILLVETTGDGAQNALARLAQDLEQMVRGYGCTVTTFPGDANLAEDFMSLAIHRHAELSRKLHTSNRQISNEASQIH